MNNIQTEVENIDSATSSCQKMEEEHSAAARRILSVVMMLTMTLIMILVVAFLFPFLMQQKSDYSAAIPDVVLYVFLAIYTLTFSILMAIYRLHIGEAARLQHYKVGFMRIRVAGSNPSTGYQSEVREALTKNAFEYISKPEAKGKVTSPLPGHPGSDFSAALVNKFLDSVEVVTKKKT